MKKSLFTLIAMLGILGITNFAIFADDISYQPLSKAQQIYGNKITEADLKGKVVFLEYWGINCPPCRASFPHLVDMYKKYSKTNKFFIIASHLQSEKDIQKAKDFLKENKVLFPVFQQLRFKEADCPDGIPHAHIIDHTGKVVEKGHPMDLIKKVDDYIKKVPERYFMISNCEVKLCAAQAKALSPKKSASPVISQLQQIAQTDNDKGREAKAILDEITKYIKEKTENLLKSAEEAPTQTYIELQDFLLVAKGLEQEDQLKKLSQKLKSDTELNKFLPLLKELNQTKEKLAEKPSKSLEKQLETVLAKIEKFKDSSSASIAKEAASIIEANK